jgi:hypothetical protein
MTAAIAGTSAISLALTLFGVASPALAYIVNGRPRWNTMPETVALRAAMEKNDVYLSTLSDVNLSMVIHERTTSDDVTETTAVEATKKDAIAHYQWVDNETRDLTKFDYFYNNNTYLESIDAFQTGPNAVADINTVLKRLGHTDAVAVNDRTPIKLAGLPDISPASVWANTDRDPFASLAGDATVIYSEVTIAPDTATPTSTVYSWEGQFVIEIGTVVGFHMVARETFNEDGLLTAVHIEETSAPYYSLTIDQTITPVAPQTLSFPSENQTIDVGKLVNMGHKIEAEKSLSKTVKSLVKKAKAIGKSKVAGKHILDAAKALKLKYKSVKNGVKLSATKSKVTGSVCVTANKGKVTSVPCS